MLVCIAVWVFSFLLAFLFNDASKSELLATSSASQSPPPESCVTIMVLQLPSG